MDCNIYVVKAKALISCAITSKLICAIVFAYAKSRFYQSLRRLPLLKFTNSQYFPLAPFARSIGSLMRL